MEHWRTFIEWIGMVAPSGNFSGGLLIRIVSVIAVPAIVSMFTTYSMVLIHEERIDQMRQRIDEERAERKQEIRELRERIYRPGSGYTGYP